MTSLTTTPISHPVLYRVQYISPFWQVCINNNTADSKWQKVTSSAPVESTDPNGLKELVYLVINFTNQRAAYDWVKENLSLNNGGAVEYVPKPAPSWLRQVWGSQPVNQTW